MPAYLDLACVGTLMQPSLATRLGFEMFDCVGHINPSAVYAGFKESLVHQLSRRTDEWTTVKVFLVSRLLAHEHDLSVRPSLSEHRLSRVFP
jgi:hypothetical protein